MFPAYPENYLYLAEAQQALGRAGAAGESVQRLLELLPFEEQAFESEQWRKAATKLTESWSDQR